MIVQCVVKAIIGAPIDLARPGASPYRSRLPETVQLQVSCDAACRASFPRWTDAMTRNELLRFAATSVSIAAFSPAVAQSLQLGQRPIRRAEVVAGVSAQFAEMDTNHDGAISPPEFEAYRAKEATMPDGNAGLTHVGSHWFDRADANGDGRVTLAEAQARPLQMFDMADSNHDGVASLDEQSLAAMMMKLGK